MMHVHVNDSLNLERIESTLSSRSRMHEPFSSYRHHKGHHKASKRFFSFLFNFSFFFFFHILQVEPSRRLWLKAPSNPCCDLHVQ